MAYSHTSLRNARSGNVKWTLRVALDREIYHAGDILQANVFLCVVEPVHCNGIMGYIRGEEKVTWSEKTARRAAGEEVYSRQNEFLNDKMIVAKPRMYGPGEYVFPVVYQLHSTLPLSFQLKCPPATALNGVHAQLGYVFHVCLNANHGVMVEAQQEVVIEEARVPTRPLIGLEAAMPALTTPPAVPSEDRLLATLDKAAYRPGDTLRVRCRVLNCSTYRCDGRESFTVLLRLFQDVIVAVAPLKQGESSRLLCERSFQVATNATAFELPLELVSGPNGAAPVERSFYSSFVDCRHRLAVEGFMPNSSGVVKTEVAVAIL
ncbi:hypothetical protein PHYPSEUDO_003378 [Phytophthora pseudosyringae]|uniref:Arrestin-like N-terminal domain-containing protein n=1 Tax=Phytophthora pseudosyringae TaxID=221518 RepID=A0A8T1VUK0_9STRA|nr:hypothetical protein PHYPSEUDO_003378 [Phytophthora pseudosyringae]